jgi:hypothetical protein
MPFPDTERHLRNYADAWIESGWSQVMINASYTQACQLGTNLKTAATVFTLRLDTLRKSYEQQGAVPKDPNFEGDNPVCVALGILKKFDEDEVYDILVEAYEAGGDRGAHLAYDQGEAKIKALARDKAKTTVYQDIYEAAEDLTDLLNYCLGNGMALRSDNLGNTGLGYKTTRKTRSGWKNNNENTMAILETWTQVEGIIKIMNSKLQVVHFTPRKA